MQNPQSQSLQHIKIKNEATIRKSLRQKIAPLLRQYLHILVECQ